MLHIGVVFVVFGVFLLGAGIIPDDTSKANAWSIFAKSSIWNELVLTGLFAIGLGVFLIILNSIISKREEDDLEAYVQSQLTRSRSGREIIIKKNKIQEIIASYLFMRCLIFKILLGHRLERDVETGGLQTRHTKREQQIRRGFEERGLESRDNSNLNLQITPTSSRQEVVVTPTISNSHSAGKTTLV
jgi:hypothetical protein